MELSADKQPDLGTTRRAFLKQLLAVSGVSASTALLAACGASSTTATAVPAATQPATLPSTAATAGTMATATRGSAPTSAASAAAPTAAAPTAGASATASATQATTPAVVAAANAFLATLSDAEKKTGVFDWTDTAQKQRWSNFPPAGFQRAGLMWGNLRALSAVW